MVRTNRAVRRRRWRVSGLRLLHAGGVIRRALKLGIPAAAAYVVVVITLMLELLIVGNEVGSKAVGAVSLASTFTLVLILGFHAIEIAGQAIVARRYGERQFEAAGACLDNALVVSVAAGAVITLALFGIGPQIFAHAKDPEISALAYEYFYWRIPSIPCLIAILAMIGFFNGIGRPKVPLVIYSVVLAMHMALMWLLVGGHFGFPALGVKGAGLAASISTAVGFCTFIGYLMLPGIRRQYGMLRFRHNVRPEGLLALGSLSLPIFIQQIFANLGSFIFQSINSGVDDGGVSLTASAVALNFSHATALPGLGFGITAATLAGQYMGAKQPRRAEVAVHVCWFIAATYMIAMGVLYIFFGGWITAQFLRSQQGMSASHNAAVIAMGTAIFIVLGSYQIFEATTSVLSKALQGLGHTKFVMMANFATQWILLLPACYLLAIVFDLRAFGAWIASMLFLAANSCVYFWKFSRGEWKSISL